MSLKIRKSGLALAIAASLVCSQGAEAKTKQHRERCTGTITDVINGNLSFAGQGLATHFGRYTIEGSNDVDDQGNVLNGQFTTTAADGSTLSGVYSGTYTPLPDGRFRFDVHASWLVGTGRLEGVTGEGDVVALLQGVAPGDAFEYVTRGFLDFPEP